MAGRHENGYFTFFFLKILRDNIYRRKFLEGRNLIIFEIYKVLRMGGGRMGSFFFGYCADGFVFLLKAK